MRKVVYECDHCEKEFGNKKHLSIKLGSYSGWVGRNGPRGIGLGILMGDDLGVWAHIAPIEAGIYHFCNGKCLAQFFKKQCQEENH